MPLDKGLTEFTTTSPKLVNFDFSDVLADVGYVNLFAMIDLANNETLIRQAIESDDGRIAFTVSTTGLQGEHNFDFKFRIPTRIEGLVYVVITYYAQTPGSGTASTFLKVRLIHLDTGASETEIGSQQTSTTVTETDANSKEFRSVTFSFDINQAFAKNEEFRLEVETHADNAPGNTQAGFLADPANRDYEQGDVAGQFAPSSQLKVLLPFPLEE